VESADLLFVFIGTVDLVLAVGFIYYAFKNAFRLRGAIPQYLMATGAFFFVITGVISATGVLIFDTIFIVRYIVFIIGFILISTGEIYSGMIIRNIVGKKPWLTIARTFSYSSYRFSGILVILLSAIPLWTLDIIIGPASIYGIVASFSTLLGFTLLIVGERKLYVMTNMFSEMAITEEREKIGLLRDDIAAVRVYADIINTFVSFGKPAMSAMIVNDTLNKWSEEHPVLFEDSVVRDGKIDPCVVTRNLDRLYEKNRLSAVLKEFSLLVTRLVDVYGGFTSSEYSKERIAESYRVVKKRYDNVSIIFDILRTMPVGILEEEKLAVLNRDELEEKVKERTMELVNANEELRNEIKERKRAEEEIKSIAKFPSENPYPVLRIKKDGKVVYSNKAGFQILDFWKTNIGEEVPERWLNIIRKKFASKNLKAEEEELNDKIFSFVVSPVVDEGYVNLYGRDITERKRVEDMLRETNQYLENLFNYANAPIIVWDPQFAITRFNHAFESLIGRSANDVIGKPLKILFPPDQVESSMELIRKTQGLERWETVEIDVLHLDGSIRTVLWNSAILFAPDGKTLVATIAQGQDITERKKAEEALKKSHQILNDTGEMAKVGGWELDLSTNEVSWTEEVGRIHGVGPGYRPKLEEALNFYTPESRSAVEAVVKKAAETGEPYDLESLFIPRGSKDKIWVRSLGKAVYSGGRIVKLTGTFQNIDKYKRADEALRENEEKYRSLIQNSKDSIVVIDLEGNVKFANEATEKLTGYSLSKGVGMNVKKITPLKYWPKSFEALQKAKKGKAIPYFESEIKRKDGEIVQVETGGQPILKDGNVVGVQIITRDITERKKIENELKDNEEKLRRIIDSSPDGIMLTDLQGNIIECNQLALEMYGTSVKKELTNRNSLDLIAPEYRERAMENMKKTLKSGIVKNLEYVLLKKDGSKYPAELSASIVNDQNDNPKYFLAIVRDISERKRAEEALEKYRREIELQNIQLKKADQLKTDFLNVTSHELRTPMSAIKGYVQIILKQALGQINDEQKKALDVVLRNTDRLDALIQDILDISRLESGTMKFIVGHMEIRKMLDEIVETMQPYANQKEIKINTQIEEHLPELVADKERIKQVIINIVHNAVKFSQSGSVVDIRARKEQDNRGL
jgi:PAS domain S-box-containing protein